MFGNAVERARGKVIAPFASNRNATWPIWMLELAVAASGGDQKPALLLQASDDVADFQSGSCLLPLMQGRRRIDIYTTVKPRIVEHAGA